MRKEFLKLYYDLLECETLNTTDILVISYLLRFQESDCECYSSVRDISYIINRAKKSVESSLTKLIKLRIVYCYDNPKGQHVRAVRPIGIDKLLERERQQRLKDIVDKIGTPTEEDIELTNRVIESLKRRWTK